jgi:hypothetical protein
VTVYLVMCGDKIIRAYFDGHEAEANRKAEASAKAAAHEHWWVRSVPVIGKVLTQA